MTIEGLTLAPVVAAAVVWLIDQLELQLADLEETAAKSEVTAVAAGVAGTKVDVHGFARRKPARRCCRTTCRASASSIRGHRPALLRRGIAQARLKLRKHCNAANKKTRVLRKDEFKLGVRKLIVPLRRLLRLRYKLPTHPR